MYWTERQLFACTGNHCNQKGAAKVINRLRFELMRRKLNTQVHLNTCGTIELCDIGPNIVVYPDNIVFSNLEENDVPEIVAFLGGGDIPERLVLRADTGAEQQRRSFYASLLDKENRVSADHVEQIVTEAGLTMAWIDEQLRRGFMSKKPDDDSGLDVYAMTSKALHRYRLG